jgi:DNA polymerase-1
MRLVYDKVLNNDEKKLENRNGSGYISCACIGGVAVMGFFDDSGLFGDDSGIFVASVRSREAKDVFALLRKATLPAPVRDPPPLPPLRHGAILALDLETEDPTLHTKGSAWAFSGIGSVLGAAIAYQTIDGFAYNYYPIGHDSGNCDQNVGAWLAYQFQRADLTWVFANAQYDLGFCYRFFTGRYPEGQVVDVQHMAAILNEYERSYALDALGQKYLSKGKANDLIDGLMAECRLTRAEVMRHLKCLPGNVVAHYAQDDPLVTLKLYHKLLPLIEAESLKQVLDLESGLIPLCTEIRRRGMRIDVERAEQLRSDLWERYLYIQTQIRQETGVTVEPWEASTCKRALETQGIEVGFTDTGKPNIDSALLARHGANKVAASLLKLRKISKVVTTFLDGHFLGHHHEGRLHPTLNQLKSERGQDEGGAVFGAVTARFSITNPGMQQAPARDPEWGPLLRGLVLPNDGDNFIASADYSSQEPRLGIHFAARAGIRGADKAVEIFRKDPYTDPHQMTASLCQIERSAAKTIYLGRSYGQGGAKTARSLGLPTCWRVPDLSWTEVPTEEVDVAAKTYLNYIAVECAGKEARELIRKMDEGAPYIKDLFDACLSLAESRNYIMGLMRRRCRFPNGAFAYKALNRLCQSSGATQTKKAMLDLWEGGVVPLLTIHDELLFSVAEKEQARGYARTMETAVELLVPSVCGLKFGSNWGNVRKD